MSTEVATLSKLVDLMRDASDPWWVITGAATALHTGDWSGVQDIDVIVSVPDARRLLATGEFLDRTDGGNDNYCSEVYATLEMPMPIDIFASFEVNVDGVWTHILPQTRTAIETEGGEVFVATIFEQLAITRALNRPKDAPRIARLEAAIAGRGMN